MNDFFFSIIFRYGCLNIWIEVKVKVWVGFKIIVVFIYEFGYDQVFGVVCDIESVVVMYFIWKIFQCC